MTEPASTAAKEAAKAAAATSVANATRSSGSNSALNCNDYSAKSKGDENHDSSGKQSSTSSKRQAAKPAEKKTKAKKEKRTPHRFVLEAFKGGEEDPEEEIHSTHRTAKEAAKAAWKFCEENGMEVLCDEWTTDTGRYGDQSCYNVMVPSGWSWDPEEVFVQYMARIAQKREVVLWGDGMIRIDKEILE
mmetsp:Transcript_2884/g.5967  ORF Transcript_2884/g.5967 Transcript_2884/m.5967 type:complete len:189 (+) Transcript_2884:431-997(+)|eukprot:CAMPEP_0178715860 /NCGR_PEP_ID=MMETSP0699-20121125/20934_1 /TAXON_ID=265572 /ORGANISM="Extubocellulus spinifer, Strain CCMP396" /LENGTH=188 /DNA_ID=CAMNT_0020365293 /DNA_START=426 /DNA_END=992 /DNA_ORIENTATION=+